MLGGAFQKIKELLCWIFPEDILFSKVPLASTWAVGSDFMELKFNSQYEEWQST